MLSKLTAIPIITALWLLTTLFRLIPLSICWKIGNLLGTLCHTLMPARRATIKKNLTIVASQNPNIKVTDKLVKKIFQRSITNLLCAIKTYTLTPAQIGKITTFQLHPDFLTAIEQKTGVILCLAHMGNWEILSKTAPHLGFDNSQFAALYRPLDNKTADRYVVKQRQKHHCQMFPKGTPMGTLSTFLKSGGALGILADQRAGGSKNNRPFFGHPSSRSKLPAILHRRTNAPLFALTLHSPEPAKWAITLKPIPVPQNATTDETVAKITASYESSFTQHLTDVFWLHTYWRDRKKKTQKAK